MFMTCKDRGMVSPTVMLSENRGMTSSILAGWWISTITVPLEDRFSVLLLSSIFDFILYYGIFTVPTRINILNTSSPT